MNMVAVKVAGIIVLAMSHAFGVALHPFLAPSKVSVITHLWGFKVWSVVALIVGHCLSEYGYNPGYPVLPGTSMVSAFVVPYSIFTLYLIAFTTLIRKGYSRQLANLAFLIILLVADMHPWHPNPLIIVVSIQANGFKWVYVLHLLAIATAVVTVKSLNAYLVPPPPPSPSKQGVLKGSGARKAMSPKNKRKW
jgi:hypothetical protein